MINFAQVWRNVAGNALPIKEEKSTFIVTVPKGTSVSLEDLSSILSNVFSAFPNTGFACTIRLSELGTIEISIKVSDKKLKEPKKEDIKDDEGTASE